MNIVCAGGNGDMDSWQVYALRPDGSRIDPDEDGVLRCSLDDVVVTVGGGGGGRAEH